MALAIQCEQLIRDGVIKNQSELAHYAQIMTAGITHIMWLTNPVSLTQPSGDVSDCQKHVIAPVAKRLCDRH